MARMLVLFLLVACSWVGPTQGNTQDPEMACIQRCPLVPDSFGTKKPDPACVKKCLLSGGAETSGIRFTPAWDTSDTRKKQKLVVEELVKNLPNGTASNAKVIGAVKSWMVRYTAFHRTSVPSSPGIPVPEMRARQGQLEFDDRFFAISLGRQKSLMMFELGKVLWISVDPSKRIDRMPPEVRLAAVRINNLMLSNHSVMMELKRTPYEGADLGDLSDGADAASPFGYALRAMMLGLEPADPAARATWIRIRPELERGIATLVTR